MDSRACSHENDDVSMTGLASRSLDGMTCPFILSFDVKGEPRDDDRASLLANISRCRSSGLLMEYESRPSQVAVNDDAQKLMRGLLKKNLALSFFFVL